MLEMIFTSPIVWVTLGVLAFAVVVSVCVVIYERKTQQR